MPIPNATPCVETNLVKFALLKLAEYIAENPINKRYNKDIQKVISIFSAILVKIDLMFTYSKKMLLGL